MPENLISINADQATAQMCLRHLWYFVREFWATVVPNELIWNWHMKAICDEVQRVDERVFERKEKEHDLIANVPPGTSKTKIVCVLATAWELARKPDLRIFVGSYSDMAVLGISDDLKIVMRSEKYRAFFPSTQILKGKDSMHLFRTTANGEFYAFAVGGTLTSKHADILKIDDPINPKLAATEKGLETANEFMSKTLPTRKVDKLVTPTILIMQRLHTNDPTGFILSRKKDKIRHVCLPAELSNRTTAEYRDSYVDGLLDPVRLGRGVLSEMKIDLGAVGYAGQFEQSPVVDGGNIIKREWYQFIDADIFTRMRRNEPFQFWLDTANTEKTQNDPTGFLVSCKIGNDLYLSHAMTRRLESPELLKAIPLWLRANGYSSASTLRIEPKANGQAITQLIRRMSGINVVATPTPKDSKLTRLNACAPKVEAGRVYLVRGGWNEEFIVETTGFPSQPHDEYVDLLCYAVDHHLGGAVNTKESLTNLMNLL